MHFFFISHTHIHIFISFLLLFTHISILFLILRTTLQRHRQRHSPYHILQQVFGRRVARTQGHCAASVVRSQRRISGLREDLCDLLRVGVDLFSVFCQSVGLFVCLSVNLLLFFVCPYSPFHLPISFLSCLHTLIIAKLFTKASSSSDGSVRIWSMKKKESDDPDAVPDYPCVRTIDGVFVSGDR